MKQKHIFRPKYKQLTLNFAIIITVLITIFSIKYFNGNINFSIVLKEILFWSFITLGIGFFTVYQLAREVQIDKDYLTIKNVITNKSDQIPFNNIISILEINLCLGGMLTHTIEIKTKNKMFLVYPDMLYDYKFLINYVEYRLRDS